MRMLMNNLDPEVAEHPEELVVYGGTGKAARTGRLRRHHRTLQHLKDDETLLVQSGKPVGVIQDPRVGARACSSPTPTSSATGPPGRSSAAWRQLGLTMYGQMTAGSWIYIGTQGILQGTYETFAAIAPRRSTAPSPAPSP